MTRPDVIFVVSWNDDPVKSRQAAQEIYPDKQIRVVEKRVLREGGLRRQIQKLRQLYGKVFVVCFRSLDDVNAPLLLAWAGLFHRCPSTVLLDDAGRKVIYGRWSWLRLVPITLIALMLDSIVLVRTWIALKTRLFQRSKRHAPSSATADFDIAYLFPYPMSRFEVGGAMSHVRGLLEGFKQAGAQCEIYTGRALKGVGFPQYSIPLGRRPFFFWEAQTLSYNWRFLRSVKAFSKNNAPFILYQRHGRFVVAGALLAHKLKLPFVLEYNGSEVWVARNWDPSRFPAWLRLCEEYALASASLIVVVSEPLCEELMKRGIPREKILVNPNGVDPDVFRPRGAADSVRAELGLAPDDLVACFVGTFSYWHGISILQKAADTFLRMTEENPNLRRLRFLLIGDGPLRGEMAAALSLWIESGNVVFTGSVPHERVPDYLDAADILLSPHVPFTDGSEFFGSPTKLFEYMAMGKAIIASNLGQIGRVLQHGETGWLVTPGSVDELVNAIVLLAEHPEVRASLGKKARAVVLEQHTWRRNAQALLETISGSQKVEKVLPSCDQTNQKSELIHNGPE